MKKAKGFIAKRKMDLILKSKTTPSNFVYEIKKRIKKEEFEILINDKDYCFLILKGFITNPNESSIWFSRAYSFINCLVSVIFSLQNENIKITLPFIKNYMTLDNLYTLFKNDIKSLDKLILYNYLNSIPSFDFNDKIPQNSYEMHNFVMMQFSEHIGSLSYFYEFKDDDIFDIEQIILIDKIDSF